MARLRRFSGRRCRAFPGGRQALGRRLVDASLPALLGALSSAGCRPGEGQGAERFVLPYGRRFRVVPAGARRPSGCLRRKTGVTEEDLKEPGGVVQRPLPYSAPHSDQCLLHEPSASRGEGAERVSPAAPFLRAGRHGVTASFRLCLPENNLFSAHGAGRLRTAGPVAVHGRPCTCGVKETATVQALRRYGVSRADGLSRRPFSWGKKGKALFPRLSPFLTKKRRIFSYLPPSSPTLRAARKASWGSSTLPMRFMRFLPSFCFSRSFLLRVMSPP